MMVKRKGKRRTRKPWGAVQAVAYYRVSTVKQGSNGLGMDAQKAAVKAYAGSKGLKIIAEYTEVETGTNKRYRPEVHKAIEESKRRQATLLIARLDRLSRSVAFTSELMDSGIKFVCVDMPEANELTIHMMAALAQYEAKMISKRTKAALAAAKARGVKLGTPENLTDLSRERSAASNLAAAKDAYKDQFHYIQLLRDNGTSYDRIAKTLNSEGKRTRQGKPFQAMTIYRILKRGNGD